MSSTKTKPQRLVHKMRPDEVPVPFTEDFKWPGANRRITFEAKSFTQWIEQLLPVVKGMKPITHRQAHDKGVKVGRFLFYLRPFPMMEWRSPWAFLSPRPMRACLSLYQRTTPAECCFSKKVNIPVLCCHNLEPWMSLTPSEIFTQRGAIRRMRGEVAMAGLGLGWAARRVLERKQVNHLTVYEKDSDVAEYFGESLMDDFGDRITIEVADAYEADWHRYDTALWDIWQDYGDASGDNKFWAIKRSMQRAGKVCEGWGQNIYGDHIR